MKDLRFKSRHAMKTANRMLIVQSNHKFSEDIATHCEDPKWTDALDLKWIKSLFSFNP